MWYASRASRRSWTESDAKSRRGGKTGAILLLAWAGVVGVFAFTSGPSLARRTSAPIHRDSFGGGFSPCLRINSRSDASYDRAMADAPKSAFELAMERLEAADREAGVVEIRLSERQKTEIAQAR